MVCFTLDLNRVNVQCFLKLVVFREPNITVKCFQAIYWDDKTVFMEHEFVGPGGFVHAVAVCRQRVIDTSAVAIAELLVQLHCAGSCRDAPSKMPQEVS